jgi:hypothetical protein
MSRGYFQNRFKVPAYKQVGRPTHDSQKREEPLEKVTNVFMEPIIRGTFNKFIPDIHVYKQEHL